MSFVARGIGPYSVVTQQPLTNHERPGQRLATESALALAEAGALATLTEMLTVKSDSVLARVRTFENLVKGVDPDPFAAKDDPLAAFSDETTRVEVAGGPRFIPNHAVRLAESMLRGLGFVPTLNGPRAELRLATNAEIRAQSAGAIARAETLNEDSLEPEEGGLLCQRIFGPMRDYECACGRYTRIHDRNTVCEDCGVLVTQSSVRWENFAHLELAAPIGHPWFPDHRLEVLPIVPAAFRPLVPLDDGRFATSDMNDLLLCVIESNARVAELPSSSRIADLQSDVACLFQNDPDAPIHHDGRPLRSIADTLHRALTGNFLSKTADYSGQADAIAAAECQLPIGMAKEMFAARVYHVLEATGSVVNIRDAKNALDILAPNAAEALAEVAVGAPLLFVSGDRIACRVIDSLTSEPKLGLDAAALDHVGARPTVHVPLSEAAQTECRRIDLSAGFTRPRPSGWFTALVLGAPILETLVAAVGSEGDPIDEPAIRCALGREP